MAGALHTVRKQISAKHNELANSHISAYSLNGQMLGNIHNRGIKIANSIIISKSNNRLPCTEPMTGLLVQALKQ
jgi:hypothetical protein